MKDKWDDLLSRLHSDDFDISSEAEEYCEEIVLPEEKIGQWLTDDSDAARTTAISSCESIDNPWKYYEIAFRSDDDSIRAIAEEQCIAAAESPGYLPASYIAEWLRSDDLKVVSEALSLCTYLEDEAVPWKQVENALLNYNGHNSQDLAMEVVYQKKPPLLYIDRWFNSDEAVLVQAGVEAIEGNGFPDYIMDHISLDLLRQWKSIDNEDVQSVTEQVCIKSGLSYDSL